MLRVSKPEKILYVSDMKVYPDNRAVEDGILETFTKHYRQNYIEKNNVIPVILRAGRFESARIQLLKSKLGEDVPVKVEARAE